MLDTENMPKKSFLRTPRKLKIIYDLAVMENKKILCFSDFERYLGYNTPQPDIREILKFLEDNSILNLVEIMRGVKLYKLNIKKLRSFLEDLDVYQMNLEYIRKTKPFHVI